MDTTTTGSTTSLSRAKALRATRAVALGGILAAACGTSPTTEPGTSSDTGDDSSAATDTPTSSDAPASTDAASAGDTTGRADAPTMTDVVPPPRDTRPPPPPGDAGGPDTPPPTDGGRVDAPTVDAGAVCSEERDGQCPDTCTTETDADCCEADDWCIWNPDWGCECAVEGPFAPPRF